MCCANDLKNEETKRERERGGRGIPKNKDLKKRIKNRKTTLLDKQKYSQRREKLTKE